MLFATESNSSYTFIKDEKTKKAYFIPDEDFQIRAPNGAATSVSFSQSGMDRTEILRGPNPDHAEFVKRLQSPHSNQSEGMGPMQIKSIEHAAGLVFEDYLFRNGIIGRDENTNEFKILAKKSINVSNLKDIEAFNLIREDNIDIMFDITGMTSLNRVSLFKNRLAPKQISWLGYCNTSGLDNMDYLIADRNLIYEEEENNYSEKIIYLPNIWNCHSGLDISRIETPAPLIKNKHITFGSFNNAFKISDEVVSVWSKILKNINNSKLIIKSSLNYSDKILKEKFEKNQVFNQITFLDKTNSFESKKKNFYRKENDRKRFGKEYFTVLER